MNLQSNSNEAISITGFMLANKELKMNIRMIATTSYTAAILSLCISTAIAADSGNAKSASDKRPWQVINPQGLPVQDAARVAQIQSIVAGFNVKISNLDPGSTLVVFSYEGKKDRDYSNGELGYDVFAWLERNDGICANHQLDSRNNGPWSGLVLDGEFKKIGDSSWRFIYKRCGCKEISITLPKQADCIIDVGDLHPVPMPTFSQEIRLVGDDGKVVTDAQGTLVLKNSKCCPGFLAKIDHGTAIIPGVSAGWFELVSKDLKDYVFVRHTDSYSSCTVETEPNSSRDIYVMSKKAFEQHKKPVWTTNYTTAVADATKTGKKLFLFFTGSDWCGFCNALKEEVFDTTAFADWANENVILVELDFPHRVQQEESLKIQNEALRKRFDINGYPTVIILDPTGAHQIGGQMMYGGGRGPLPWIETAKGILSKGN